MSQHQVKCKYNHLKYLISFIILFYSKFYVQPIALLFNLKPYQLPLRYINLQIIHIYVDKIKIYRRKKIKLLIY